MNSSLIRSSTTQLKIVVLALLASIAVAAAGIMSRPVVETTTRALAAVDVGTTMIAAQNRSSTVR